MIFALLVTLALSVQLEADFRAVPLKKATVSWQTFKDHFRKVYRNEREEAKREKIYWENVDRILEHNEKRLSWTLGVNEFADLTPNEFQSIYLNNTFPERERNPTPMKGIEIPSAKDWVDLGGVTDVKNQGQCGSCWAFSTTGALEGAWFVKHGSLISLSEQELVSCDRTDNGCQGGLMDYGFNWVKTHGGLASESAYPYTSGRGVRGSCDSSKSSNPVATVASYVDVTPNSVEALKEAVANGPCSVAVEADKSAWQFYKSGILSDESCGTQLDHGVLVVGYADGYFKVKNSWGPSWGESGYIRLSDQSSNRHGICGVLSQPSYPVAGSDPGPGPGPSPGPTPTPGQSEEYGNPANGCPSNCTPIQVQGVSGSFCSPKCGFLRICDALPADMSGTPTCALEDASSGDRYCADICDPDDADSCGSGGAKCQSIQGTGICTWE